MKRARAKGGAQQGERRSESLLTGFPGAPGIRAEGGVSSSLLSQPVLILPYENAPHQHNAATCTLSFAKEAQYF